ncbi:MAG: extracellular solute-binding protein [Gammaproteobacteria bacterium]|uniref:extracellular solute-binding protein n=1 Tax=Pseudomaricurvus alcaniphilus TaxID=1166482 RepID=UPI00140E411C|nr:extracellular solute-binding protein [Pseudomaricurvus alcaniphilus]MBR9912184.1 extracellular solute-binding protein [Gammaproteobacteria bacterium]NHN38751.1 extracellular solute-binding protein [Pseudomaricurvus alcaniphilus]
MRLSLLRSPLALIFSLLLTAFLSGCDSNQGDSANATSKQPTITVYTSRNEHLVKPLFEQYTAETGVKIRYITDEAGPLIQRLKAEGEATPADMLITVDVGNLWLAASLDLFQPLQSPVLEANIPATLRDPENRWAGLSVRARTIAYATDRVEPAELSTYEALADSSWNGRLCLRTSKKVYNQSLVASMIQSLGQAKAEQVVQGWVENLATAPYSNDNAAMEAVLAGQCDVTIVNTYYYGRLKKANPAAKMALFWPNQADRGVHINVSGAGVTKYAKQPQEAQKFLEWLSSTEAQGQFAEINQEYPANPAVPASAEVRSWGDFKADALNVEAAGRLQGEAVKLMDRAGYF